MVKAHFDVFLSHSSLDDKLAEDVKTLLEYNEVSVFCTPNSIPSGKWEPQIEDALQNSDDLWVMLTANALGQSVWVHQELGYFYGFRHGTGSDILGNHSHYLYESATLQPGLYAELQGIPVEQIGDPVEIATIIANDLGKSLQTPIDWSPRVYRTSRIPSEDSELFRAQSRQLEGEVVDRIRSEGHWELSIRPETYLETRVSSLATLESVVKQGYVSHTRIGWDFPSLESSQRLHRGSDWCGDSVNYSIPEEWRFYQSGQFIHLWAFSRDMNDYIKGTGMEPDSLFSVASAVYYITLAYEFASKIARNVAGDEWMVVDITAHNIRGKSLAIPSGAMNRNGFLQTEASSIPNSWRGSSSEIESAWQSLASQTAIELFQRFGWDDPQRAVAGFQSRILS